MARRPVSPTSYSLGTTTGQTGVQSSQILHFSGSTYCAFVWILTLKLPTKPETDVTSL